MAFALGDEVVFFTWNPSEENDWTQHDAIIAVITGPPSEAHLQPKIHLTFVDGGVKTRVNNVENVENWETQVLRRGNDYWAVKRVEFTDSLPVVTTRPSVGDVVWYVTTTGTVSGLVRSIPGDPSDQHPKINLTWVDDETDINVNNVEAIENASGGDHWLNRVDQRGDLGT